MQYAQLQLENHYIVAGPAPDTKWRVGQVIFQVGWGYELGGGIFL